MPLNQKIDNWQGRRLWLIGASSGIGAALASELHQRGALLALSARPSDRLDALCAATQTLSLPCDVTDDGALEAAAEALQNNWGGVDHVVYLAARYAPMRGYDLDLDAIRDTVTTNLLGAYRAVAVAQPLLQGREGASLVLVASVAGYRGLPTAVAYGPSKAALIHLAETLYLDLAPRGIGVHLVNPGFVRTPLTDRNDFPMPARIEPDQAAREMLRGMERGQFEITFPRRFTSVMKMLRWLPDRLYFALIHRLTGL